MPLVWPPKYPPHNLGELVDTLLALIKRGKINRVGEKTKEPVELIAPEKLIGEFDSTATVDHLMKFLKGPDFPTGGAIYGRESIKEAYATGRGKIIVRATATIEEGKKGKTSIIVSQLPFQVNKARLVAKIADLVKNKKIKNISNLRDESDRQGMRIVIILHRRARPQTVLNRLFQYTQMQTTFPVNIVALTSGIPKTLNLKNILSEYLIHRQIVIVRRSQYELKAAKRRSHILEGLMIALKNLDKVIKTIRNSPDTPTAKKRLMKRFGLTQIQAEAILEMRLRQLTRLERSEIEDEYKMLQETISKLTNLLNNPQEIIKVIKDELRQIKKDFADPRRTKVFVNKPGEFSEQDLIPSEEAIVTLTKSGYIKRIPPCHLPLSEKGRQRGCRHEHQRSR